MFQSFFSNSQISPLLHQVRRMSKRMTKAATKRQPLSPKRVGKGYYKGKGGTKEGRLTSKGRFIVDPLKRLQLIVPDLEGFKVSTQGH
jgi:large subunit ribosomal protein L41